MRDKSIDIFWVELYFIILFTKGTFQKTLSLLISLFKDNDACSPRIIRSRSAWRRNDEMRGSLLATRLFLFPSGKYLPGSWNKTAAAIQICMNGGIKVTHYISFNSYFYYIDSFGKVDCFHVCSTPSSPFSSPFVPSTLR